MTVGDVLIGYGPCRCKSVTVVCSDLVLDDIVVLEKEDDKKKR